MILSHFGWTDKYLLSGIRWPDVQKMLADSPSYNTDDESKEPQTPKQKKTNTEKYMSFLNSIQ